MKSNEELEGIVNFWDLSTKLHVKLNPKFKEILLSKFLEVNESGNEAGKSIGSTGPTIRNYLKENSNMRTDFIIKIANLTNINLSEIQKNIIWIGDDQSHGIINPKLPFSFNCGEGARFLAAICNDGWISDGVYYSNSDEELRSSVKKDVLSVFGGDENTVHEWIKEKDQYLSFPSVIRDVLILITGFKGVKSENNPQIPAFILKNQELMRAWIGQTIADEGYVKDNSTGHREIIWTRSFKEDLEKYKLYEDEIKMLNSIGIDYTTYVVGRYNTERGIRKIRKSIRISGRENLLKFRQLIKIPCRRKDETFTEMLSKFVRYKEPLAVRDAVKRIYGVRGYVTSSLLRDEMNYKTVNVAIKWLKLYESQGMLRCIKRSYYLPGGYRRPAKYVFNKQIV